MGIEIPWWAHLVLGVAVGVTVMFPVMMGAVWWATRATPEERQALRDYKRLMKAERNREVDLEKRKAK